MQLPDKTYAWWINARGDSECLWWFQGQWWIPRSSLGYSTATITAWGWKYHSVAQSPV